MSSIHIELLTRGLEVPLDPIDRDLLLFVIETLGVVYQETIQHDPCLVYANENDVTARLVTNLCTMLETNAMFSQIVTAVTRGAETVNFNGEKLEKRPDFSFAMPIMGRQRHPLIAEAKIIDKSDKKTTQLYCTQGVQRFLDGDYAWACREAIMVAYVRDNTCISNDLAPHLATGSKYAVQQEPVAYDNRADLATSKHERTFFVEGHSPGPIELWHLWLT